MATVVVSGYIVPFPLSGNSWHFLHYLLGMRALGHDVYYFETRKFGEESESWYFDPLARRWVTTPAAGIACLERLMSDFGFGDRWCFLDEEGGAGMSTADFGRVLSGADVLISLDRAGLPAPARSVPTRIYIDTNPVFTQVRAAAGGRASLNYFARFTRHFTYGALIGGPDCTVPQTPGIRWLPMRPPIALEHWPAQPPDAAGRALTTVSSWSRWSGDRATIGGEELGGKDQEFEDYFTLPRRVGRPLELAVTDQAPRDRLVENGWRLVDALEVTADPGSYRDYIQGSAGEWSVAEKAYVATQCGWFSDRSAAYLASGRPVILQETGFSRWLPTGEGLLSFRTPEEARDAIRQLDEDYAAHCQAARRIAERFFDAETVLGELLDPARYR